MNILDQLVNGNLDELVDLCNSVDLQSVYNLMNNTHYRQYLLSPAGSEHHKLITLIASQFPGKTVYDIGTHFGTSSLALSTAPVNVISYDIVNVRQIAQVPDNVEYKIGDFRFDSQLLASPFIFIDVDPHDGIQEKEFHEFFLAVRYKGITLWDDIHLSPVMEEWWNSIESHKVDLTKLGHASGTGMIVYK